MEHSALITRFVSFTVIGQEGKIAYLTMYAALSDARPAFTVTADVLKNGITATKVVWKHFFDMFSRKAKKIVPLYADEYLWQRKNMKNAPHEHSYKGCCRASGISGLVGLISTVPPYLPSCPL